MLRLNFSPAIFAALGAAVLFGGSTPFAKQLIGDISPLLFAGLLYFGSGIGLIFARLIRDKGWKASGLLKKDWLWLSGAIGFGGVLGPTLLMVGLVQTSAAAASLLLNMEAVLTAMLAWIIFRESTDRRMVFGMLFIVFGGILLSYPTQWVQYNWMGPLAIMGACLCWAIDNNLTREVSASDSLFIAASKGLVSGTVSVGLALALGVTLPSLSKISFVMIIGFFGYGVSLVLFVLALRGLGTARTGAYFSTAPFIGAAIAIIFFHESTSILFWVAAALMSTGVLVHLTENHEHEHTHELIFHNHFHVHDIHHHHAHDFYWDGKEPHSHSHQHESMTHTHSHYPDIHHTHK